MENFIDPKNIKQKISYLREKLNTSSHKYYVLNQPDITDQEYYNNIAKDGWYIESGFTDLQESGFMYFKEKEGKWFSYMKGKSVSAISDLNSK